MESTLSYTKYLEIEQFEDKVIIQDYICPLCTGVYNNPVVDGCGHVFCSDCINISMKKSVYCPISYRDLSKDSFHQIPFISSIIAKHVINCKNKCGWKKSLSNYQAHLDEECPNILLSCKFTNCKKCYLRSEKESHETVCEYRLLECEFCKASIAFVELSKHYDVCPNIKVECHQNCELQIQRSEIEKHVKEVCPKTHIDCIFKVIGCNMAFTRSEENEHNEISKDHHLKLIGKSCGQQILMKEEIIKLKEEIDILKERFDKLKDEFTGNRKYNQNELSLNESIYGKSLNKPTRPTGPYDDYENSKNNDLLNKKRIKPDETDIKKIDYQKNALNQPNKLLQNRLNQPNSKNLVDDYSNDSTDEKHPYGNGTTGSLIDKENSSDCLLIVGNKITCNSLAKNKHKFVFANNIFDSNYVSWKIYVNKKTGWMGFGLAKQKKVIDNQFSFSGNSNNFDHGCFLISSNGYFWNCGMKSQNNCKINDFTEPSTGEIISFKYNKLQKTLEISYNKFTIKLESISSEYDDLRPCAILMANGDEITFSASSS